MTSYFRDDYPLAERLAEAGGLLELSRMVQDERITTRQAERAAAKQIKQKPDDNDAIADVMELEARRRTVTFDSRDRSITIEEHSLKSNSNRTQADIDYALRQLVEIWIKGTGCEIQKTTDWSSGEPGDEFFYWAAEQLEKWDIETTPTALLHRHRKG